VRLPLESVPNFSEGRDRATIDALSDALGERAQLLDVHADADHNRSVFTLVGEDDELVAALLAGIVCARERIDLRSHEGAHPRIGAADVVPLVPIVPDDMPRAREAARELARRVGEELGLPVFLYGELSPGLGPAFFRKGDLQSRIDAGELEPDYGPKRLDERAGGVLVGARRPLIAFNVNLRGELDAARAVAAVVRETGGGFPGVRALGLDLPSAGLVQVSMNVEDWEAAALHEIVARVEDEARARDAVPDTLWLLEHPPTITLGRRAEPADVLVDGARLAALGIRVHDTNRGGLVTYHGPGQLVGYPICALRELTGGDVVRYVSGLEETLIRVLDGYGIRGERDACHRGVWVGGAKIGAVGVAISRGVTMHGFALNLQPDLAHFGLIRPCGIADRDVTSVAALLGRPVDLTASADATASAFGTVFGRDMLAREMLLDARVGVTSPGTM